MRRHLRDLDPHWIRAAAGGRVGVRFACPTCPALEGAPDICVLFANPLDGAASVPVGSAFPGENEGRRWQRTGDELDNLTLSPSVDCSRCGHWHGFVDHGDAT